MSWIASMFVALLTAIASLVASGFAAALAVDWYHIPGFEGESGYFVAGLAILGMMAGGAVGLIAARIVARSAEPGFLKALCVALAVAFGLVGTVGGVARALADVPPEIDGEPLLLAVEIRWPAERAVSPATDTAEGYLQLHSIPRFSQTVRASERGPLWKGDAHLVDGRWVAPGAVAVFTSRGSRMLEVVLDDSTYEGFQLELPGHPGAAQRQWSEWLPVRGPGAPSPTWKLTYRYRVQPISEPIRRQSAGPFEVETIASGFFEVQAGARNTLAASARFSIRYRGQPAIIRGDSGDTGSAMPVSGAAAVATVGGTSGALLVLMEREDGGACYLLSDSAGRLHSRRLAECGGNSIGAAPLTNDSAAFRSSAALETIRGRIDTATFRHPGLYLLGNAVIDTRTLNSWPFTSDSILTGVPSVPPLGVSPDERSFVRFGYRNGSSDSLIVAATDFVADRSYALPVDPLRMRYPRLEALDPAWLMHHFAWQRGGDGGDHLIERAHFAPLPYQGELSVEGGRSYRIEKAGDGLRSALVAWLIATFHAERMPADSGAYEQPVRIGGQTVHVAASRDFEYVMVSLPSGATDTTLVADIGRRFNRELATGRFDSLFGK